MSRSLTISVAIAGLFIAGGCARKTQENIVSNPNEVAVIDTSKGKMVVEFWDGEAPKTVANFKKLARSGAFDGTCFHRIVKGFMIQGGDPLTKDEKNADRFGTGGPGYSIDAEFNSHPHVRGVLSMARPQDPHSAGSQFFVCLDAANFLDGKYTAFGHLIAGEAVLMVIGDTPTREARNREKSVPTERITVNSVKILPREEALK